MKIKIFTLLLAAFLLTAGSSYAQTSQSFNLGMDALNNARYSQAVKDFKAALDENPDDIGYRFYYALALYYSGDLNGAKLEFQKIVKDSGSSSWGKTSAAYIKYIDFGIHAPKPQNDIKGSLTLLYESNDNMAYTPYLIEGGWDKKSFAQISTTFQPMMFSSRPLSFTLNGFGSAYDINKSYNEYGGSGDMTLNIPLFFGTLMTLSLGRENYYQTQEAAAYYTNDFSDALLVFNLFPELQTWTSVFAGRSYLAYSDVSFEGYSGDNWVYGIRQNLNMLTYIEYNNKNSKTKSTDYTYISDEYSVGATIPMPHLFKLFISEKFINKGFLYPDSIGGKKRHDTAYIFDFFLSRQWDQCLTLGARYTYTNYSSNLDKAHTALSYGSYTGHVFSISLAWDF